MTKTDSDDVLIRGLQVTLDAGEFDDWDDCLDEAAHAVAMDLGVADWEVDAAWGDDDRETIVVTVSR